MKKEVTPLFGTPATGRVIVRLLADKQVTDQGWTIPDGKREAWGVVEAVGPPALVIFTEEEVRLWKEDGIHPVPFKKGDSVLMPQMTGRKFKRGDDLFMVFWQHEIAVYESSVE